MGRLFSVILALFIASAAVAQDFGALARFDPVDSRIADTRHGLAIELHLSTGVPYRIFTLDDPRRLVIDFREVDWTGADPEELLEADRITSLRLGPYVPGWSRLVAELAEPLGVSRAQMRVDGVTGGATLDIELGPVTEEAFAASAGAPQDPRWDLPPPETVVPAAPRNPDAALRVVIDPGHGGLDPGAETAIIDEKTLMLVFARELREELLRAGGFEVVLTREDDRFVSLERRVSIAHEAQADVFISLHADSLSEGQAHGATVHVLAETASDTATELLAERHERNELLSGVDLSRTDDEVAEVLMDLARRETRPRTQALAEALVEAMAATGAPMNNRPLRRAAFSVLKAADIPSVLIEIGFLSSPRDLKNITDPDWRAVMARGLRNGLRSWAAADAAQRPLIRK